jgi:hypothetical protein
MANGKTSHSPDVAILWSKRVKVGSKTRQNRLINLSTSLSNHKIYTQLLLSEFLLSLNSNYVSKWKKRFITQGIPGLKLGYRGAKTKLTTERKNQHKVVIMPTILGYIRTRNIFNREVRCHI